jgi:hypothetical protein
VDTGALVELYVRAWNEDDDAARRALLDSTWADGGVYRDPMSTLEGRDAVLAHIVGFRERVPGGRIEVRSGVDEHGPHFRFAWAVLEGDGSVRLEGIDVGRRADDGRIAEIVGFFGPLPELD